MNLAEFAARTHIWQHFKRGLMTLWLPFFLLAVIPTIITLAASLPFAVNFFSAIVPLFGVAAYLTYRKFGVIGLVSVALVFLLGLSYRLLNLISAIGPTTTGAKIPTGSIDRIEGGGGTLVVLIAMVILFGAATYFAGRLKGDGETGLVTVIVVFILIGLTLSVGGLRFG